MGLLYLILNGIRPVANDSMITADWALFGNFLVDTGRWSILLVSCKTRAESAPRPALSLSAYLTASDEDGHNGMRAVKQRDDKLCDTATATHQQCL